MPRVLLVNDTDKPIAELREALQRAGYEILADVAHARALLHAVETQRPDVILIDTESPTRDTLEQLAVMNAAAPRPVVMFSDAADQSVIRAAVRAGVTTYVVDGMAPAKLAPILEVACARFDEEDKLRRRLAEVEQQLADRKDIDRAKGWLMDRHGLSEAEAFELLRGQAMKQGVRLGDVARQLLSMPGQPGP
ncbi:ANTAR domain-containing response regulator [Pigmentiphaga kullae]|uniref:Response regulator receiver and ANTAR domain protein n=1 Tax=Pigmentiphaga kullae TaxID=151784 RepID=A0A4Q7NHF9_9BURK|nr:ANTAR domain-containing protein [Pigmentiphaga kullae]RZS84172.1 response regulator receiver and ANTAR domain protein [Pigmentiphaga kullae]